MPANTDPATIEKWAQWAYSTVTGMTNLSRANRVDSSVLKSATAEEIIAFAKSEELLFKTPGSPTTLRTWDNLDKLNDEYTGTWLKLASNNWQSPLKAFQVNI